MIPVPLNHVPVRSKQQIIRKAILGSYAFALKKNRNPGEGYHWDLMAKKIREKNYNLNDRDLLEIALNYAVEEGKVSANDLVVDCLKIGHQGDCIEFKELSDINLLKSFDMEIASLVEKLK